MNFDNTYREKYDECMEFIKHPYLRLTEKDINKPSGCFIFNLPLRRYDGSTISEVVYMGRTKDGKYKWKESNLYTPLLRETIYDDDCVKLTIDEMKKYKPETNSCETNKRNGYACDPDDCFVCGNPSEEHIIDRQTWTDSWCEGKCGICDKNVYLCNTIWKYPCLGRDGIHCIDCYQSDSELDEFDSDNESIL